jgi:hypothetical protein
MQNTSFTLHPYILYSPFSNILFLSNNIIHHFSEPLYIETHTEIIFTGEGKEVTEIFFRNSFSMVSFSYSSH